LLDRDGGYKNKWEKQGFSHISGLSYFFFLSFFFLLLKQQIDGLKA